MLRRSITLTPHHELQANETTRTRVIFCSSLSSSRCQCHCEYLLQPHPSSSILLLTLLKMVPLRLPRRSTESSRSTEARAPNSIPDRDRFQ